MPGSAAGEGGGAACAGRAVATGLASAASATNWRRSRCMRELPRVGVQNWGQRARGEYQSPDEMRLMLTRREADLTEGARGVDCRAHNRFAGHDEIIERQSRPARVMKLLTVDWRDVNEGDNARRAAFGPFRRAPAQIIAEITAGIMRERSRQPG